MNGKIKWRNGVIARSRYCVRLSSTSRVIVKRRLRVTSGWAAVVAGNTSSCGGEAVTVDSTSACAISANDTVTAITIDQ